MVWSPHLKRHKLEKVQRVGTKIILNVIKLLYEERLQKLEHVVRENFLVKDSGRTRGHHHESKKTRCLKGYIKNQLSKWNGLEAKVMRTSNINEFRTKSNKSRYGGKTTRV